MAEPVPSATRYLGLDIHKQYLIAMGVDREQTQVYGPKRVEWKDLERWIEKALRPTDAVVLEMTTNTYRVHDALVGHVQSVTVVHPPHVKLIAQARVKTDRKDALALAKLHAAGLLPAVWIPPQEVRDLRTIIAQRRKMVTLRTIAKNRLQAVLHRHHFGLPETGGLYSPKNRDWWLSLPVSGFEMVQIRSNLDTLDFADQQVDYLDGIIGETAATDPRCPLLVQLIGFGVTNAMTVLAAIGDITRFPKPKKLVGYSGIGAKVHSSGERHYTGGITKDGRRDLRYAMVEAAGHAAEHHPHWKEVFRRLEPRLGRGKALVVIARKLLVVVWHILTKEATDRHANAQQVACSLFGHAYKVGVKNLPEGQTAKQFVRAQLDRLGIGQELTEIPWGTRTVKLPPSTLIEKTTVPAPTSQLAEAGSG